MLLVGIDATAFTYRKCLASEVFVIAMISQESTESKVWSDVVTTFEAHTPSAGFISEMVAQGEVELPIDIGITVIGQLCLCRHGEDESQSGDRQYSHRNIFYCFHTCYCFKRLNYLLLIIY